MVSKRSREGSHFENTAISLAQCRELTERAYKIWGNGETMAYVIFVGGFCSFHWFV